MYSQTGSYIVLAGILANVLAYLGIHIEAGLINQTIIDLLTLIGDVAVIYGTVHQALAHKQLAITTGAYPKK